MKSESQSTAKESGTERHPIPKVAFAPNFQDIWHVPEINAVKVMVSEDTRRVTDGMSCFWLDLILRLLFPCGQWSSLNKKRIDFFFQIGWTQKLRFVGAHLQMLIKILLTAAAYTRLNSINCWTINPISFFFIKINSILFWNLIAHKMKWNKDFC